MSGNPIQFYNLETIANWQLGSAKVDADKVQVELPPLQRGYVWKPKQVETLWDSLLRGFPIGSFLVSENGVEKRKMDLLDGQQRATAIAIGYYNPWNDNKHPQFYSNKFNKNPEKTVPVLWVDIAVKDDEPKGERNDFLFLPRLVTQSHPWGYKRNGEILSSSLRRDANIEFNNGLKRLSVGNEKYPHFNLKYVYPWISEFPVPIVFLIEALNESRVNWREKLIDNCDRYLSHIGNYNETVTYSNKLMEILNEKMIVEKMELAIETLNQTVIPIITLKRKQLEEEANKASADDSTLFIRINTLGTPLNGEELIYSIFKAVFPESKRIVEDAATGFIAPSRIITLISRIVLTDVVYEGLGNREHSIPYQLTAKQFKERIKDNDDPFYKGLKYIDDDKNTGVNLLFKKVKNILIGDKDYQLPVPLAVEISKGNADILFILLYWLHKANPNVEDIIKDEELHKQILTVITALGWFALDTNKLLKNLSKNKWFINGEIEFWNPESFNHFISVENPNDRWITWLPEPDFVRSILNRKINNAWEQIFDEDEDGEKKNRFLEFFNRLNWNRSLLLFVQRQYIKDKFIELQWDTLLEDSNRPFDWDHIYPDSWVYYQQNISSLTKEWHSSIGNFRALALEVNRSESDRNSPKERLDNKKRRIESFITEGNWISWQRINDKINDGEVETLATAIVNRVADIYENWYSTLNVGKLFEFKHIVIENPF